VCGHTFILVLWRAYFSRARVALILSPKSFLDREQVPTSSLETLGFARARFRFFEAGSEDGGSFSISVILARVRLVELGLGLIFPDLLRWRR